MIIFLGVLINTNMSKVCEICGKGPQVGHNVSHSMRHTKRRFMPNLIEKKVFVAKTGESKKMKVCAKCLRTVTKG